MFIEPKLNLSTKLLGSETGFHIMLLKELGDTSATPNYKHPAPTELTGLTPNFQEVHRG
jgi:hypothetical protein